MPAPLEFGSKNKIFFYVSYYARLITLLIILSIDRETPQSFAVANASPLTGGEGLWLPKFDDKAISLNICLYTSIF